VRETAQFAFRDAEQAGKPPQILVGRKLRGPSFGSIWLLEVEDAANPALIVAIEVNLRRRIIFLWHGPVPSMNIFCISGTQKSS
jgi:hypothetical protein